MCWKILYLLLKESLSYSNRLDDLEKNIIKSNEELKKYRVINKDAFVARENASNEFSKFEDKVYKYKFPLSLSNETILFFYLNTHLLSNFLRTVIRLLCWFLSLF